jgi:hypothetical protein
VKHNEFFIGRAFTAGHCLWCRKGIGTRTVVAIRIDWAEIAMVEGGRQKQSEIDARRKPGCLSYPPCALAEVVSAAYDFPGVVAVAERDMIGLGAQIGAQRCYASLPRIVAMRRKPDWKALTARPRMRSSAPCTEGHRPPPHNPRC